ncbi:MAG: PIN domain nuclease [Anaerolineae bacterium]|nr:PIN domain nuclease [Anaerolineae bacterium]
MSVDFTLRLVGMVILSFGGLSVGLRLAALAGDQAEVWAIVSALVGALFGLILTPHLTTRPARAIRDHLSAIPPQQLVAGVVGLIIGLIIAALASLPLSLLPAPYNAVMPVIAAIVFSYFGTSIFAMRRRDIFDLFGGQIAALQGNVANDGGLTASRKVLLDTSVIIDGRIADISQTGFIMGPMLVPRFILNELQFIADSSDPLRRQRGRRGISILNDLQKKSKVPIEISDVDVEGIDSADEKLIILAKQMRCAIVTNDYNLNRIAELQGILVLNINELTNAVKAVYMPGEDMMIEIVQRGREHGQGIGYLDDGTMVVVEDGVRYMNQTVQATVTRALQTAAGRMIFARPVSSNN